jgi:hypothetical protein
VLSVTEPVLSQLLGNTHASLTAAIALCDQGDLSSAAAEWGDAILSARQVAVRLQQLEASS